MNILITTPTFYPYQGGAESFLQDLLRQFADSGHSVTVFTSLPSDSDPVSEIYHDIQIIRSPYPAKGITRLTRSFAVFRRLWHVLRTNRIHVVCIGLVGIESVFVAILHRLMKFQLVVILHGSELRSYVRISRPVRWALRQALRRCKTAIAVSKALQEEAMKFEPSVKNKISVIPCGIELDKFGTKRDVLPDERYVLFVGRLHKVKDVPTVIRAFREVAEQIAGLNLFLIGSGPEETSLRAMVSELRLDDQIRFLGPLERNQVIRWIQGCEFLVLPSSSEGCPLSILEALAAGKTVIASNVTGTDEIVRDEDNGILFDYGNSETLANKMINLCKDTGRRNQFEKRIQESGLSSYDIRNIARKHMELYSSNQQPLRICLISASYYRDENCGGISSYYYQLNQSLLRLGHHVQMITSSGNTAPELGNETYINPPWSSMIAVSGRKGGLKRLIRRLTFAYRACRIAHKIDRQNGLDVLVAPELFAQGLFLSLFMRNRLITRIHAPTMLVDRWNNRRRSYNISRILSVPEKIQARRSAAIFVATKFLANNIQNAWNIPVEKIRILPTGMNVEWVRQLGMQSGKDIEGRYLLYFGRLEQLKGVHVLSESLQSVFQDDPEIKMVWIGRDWGGKDSIEENLRQYRNRMVFYDTMKKEQLFPIVFHSTLVVLPSLFENFSNAGLEAMALERPVIATFDTGFSEMIHSGIDGFLVEPGNAGALARQITECLKRNDLEQIGKKAYQSVKRLDAVRVGEQVAKFFRDVLQERRCMQR